ncbi:divalent-cation tolerance protein CutA [Qipengyuania sp. XHP0211]|uniref:divalent-cation tolerance protein CutA n=1 Tax=Qipengyuania sp. XHP0211 TaxID=3038079 RepID=UPI00241C7824|nr:divalent-cation tolerance protein CutA [Qipengyuania sp. XHP0211]MDG5752018.1 divalent-cation tolerance protein CutA [Qipengyuania sp. XHP0211]
MTALIYCSFPDQETAAKIGATLLDEELIGCINIGGPIHSLFAWDGERGEGTEVPALLKTHARLLDSAIARLESLHPYDAPAIVGWNCDAAGAATQAWLDGVGPALGG